MPKYKVGDSVWYAKCRWEPIRTLCPTCFGKKKVTLILGNGDQVTLPCEGCGRGYDPPSGYVHEYDYVVEPESIVICGMNVSIDGNKEKVDYRGGYGYVYYEDDLFLTREEALAKAQEKKAELENEQRTRSEYIKKEKQKSFSWNANYHMREAKRMRQQAEYHDGKAILCKAKSKTDEVKGGEK
jgi:hypothetical protein